jgi:ankyrin repeat protein
MELLAGPLRLATGMVVLILLFIAYDRYKTWRQRANSGTLEDNKAIKAVRFGVRILVWLFILTGVLAILSVLMTQYRDRSYSSIAQPAVSSKPAVSAEVKKGAKDFITAARAGDIKAVSATLQFVNLDKPLYGSNDRPLAVALNLAPKDSHGDTIILHLLERGADASRPEDLLARAIYQNRLDLVDEFLDAGASVQPALAAALRCKCDDRIKGVFARLLANGADPYAKDADGHDVFVPRNHLDYVNEDSKRLLLALYEKRLAAQGDSGDAITAEGRTRLVEAVVNGDPLAVERYLAAGADPNKPTPKGKSPLGFAVMLNDEEIVRLLLRAGANPHLPSITGSTPLTLAAYGFERNLDILRLLFAQPGDIDTESDGKSALYSATMASKRYAIRYLMAAGAYPWRRSTPGEYPLSAVSRQFPYFAPLLPEFVDALPAGTDGQGARFQLLTYPDANDDQRSELLDYLLGSGLRLDIEVAYFNKPTTSIYEHLKNNFTRDGQTRSLKRLEAAFARQALGEVAYLHRVIATQNARAAQAA